MATVLGDCIEIMKNMESNSVDSIITDPPYELGFMCKKWDSTGIAFNCEVWSEALRVLKPGGHILAFGGTRTFHRMVCAMEDAGFEIRDMIEWVYGSGFPKSNNIGKSIDKLCCNKRIWISKNPNKASEKAELASAGKCQSGRTTHPDITKGISKWEGWGSALKPAHEPICLARKPIEESTIAKNVLKYGTGGINIDKCRVEIDVKVDNPNIKHHSNKKSTFSSNSTNWDTTNIKSIGRFPANIIHDGSDAVLEVFPYSKSGGAGGNGKGKLKGNIYGKMNCDNINKQNGIIEEGSAARFFYCAKVSKSERNQGCECLEDNRNIHPTVKPQKLLKYLITLITPENGIVLDPFMGSGSTGMAAYSLKREFIGIELNEEYYNIANKRINSINTIKEDKEDNLFSCIGE